jgi:hypothetical protein
MRAYRHGAAGLKFEQSLPLAGKLERGGGSGQNAIDPTAFEFATAIELTTHAGT